MEALGRIMPRVLKKQALSEDAVVLALLAPLWPRVAGKALAEQARPVAFRAGVLTLGTSCPLWARALRGLREEIRAAVNSGLGEPVVKELRVRHTSEPRTGWKAAQPGRSAESGPSLPNTEGLAADLDGWGASHLDPAIRVVLERSFEKYFARAGGGAN